MTTPRWTRRDTHLKRITGVFEPIPENFVGFHPERTDRPEFMLGIEIGSKLEFVTLLVDTGADSTTLSPRHAYELLGEDYARIDFRNDSRLLRSVGVGGYAYSVARPARYYLKADDGSWLDFYAPIMIAEPIFSKDRSNPSRYDNWDAPSLLGRDILRFFELHLDYHPSPHMELWYDEEATHSELRRLRRWYDYLDSYES